MVFFKVGEILTALGAYEKYCERSRKTRGTHAKSEGSSVESGSSVGSDSDPSEGNVSETEREKLTEVGCSFEIKFTHF